MGSGSKLMIISGIILAFLMIVLLIGLLILGDSSLVNLFIVRVILFLCLSIGGFVIGLVAAKKEPSTVVGGIGTGIYGFFLLATLVFIFRIILPLLPAATPGVKLVWLVSLLIMIACESLGLAGGIKQLLAGTSGGA
jgi:hypothetical protein